MAADKTVGEADDSEHDSGSPGCASGKCWYSRRGEDIESGISGSL